MSKATPLNDAHRRLGARMVDFGGWDMPINYGSQIDEHHAVRRDCGMFDVSHMTVVDLEGAGCRDFLRRLMANDVDRLKGPGRALYTCMLDPSGGVIDDLIVYRRAGSDYRLVVNAATREADLEWLHRHAGEFAVAVRERPELAMVAVQGPNARARVAAVLGGEAATAADALARFAFVESDDLFIARTGYTGEDGYEVVLPAARAEGFWQGLLDAGVAPCGLGARDTLRLEAGMNLYGQDMDRTTTPLESGLAWTVAMTGERDFIGRAALAAQLAAGVPRQLVGLVLDERGVLRHGQRVLTGQGEGEVTSGSFSPTTGKSIALARIPAGEPGQVRVDVRGRELAVRVVQPPFVRDGAARPGI
ncbi:MAG: glycine cleavage system aminomethyltransferase GcvT [Pseudoxanthomonas sp.]|nr:glycine cleavage system aminomethyltransferase GcvT [Pseudoxanthomonas sp.]